MSNAKPQISIVIPTLNEERFLPKLLTSISKQRFKDYEVIVADAGSKDHTVKLAKEWGARVVKGGMPGPGRNAGARAARSDMIFFLDADVELPDDFFEPALAEIEKKGLECATWGVYANDGDISYQLLFEVLSKAQRVGTKFGARLAGGFALFCTKRVFDEINGFDETLFLSEDHDFVDRAADVGKYGFISTVTAGLSARRWQKEGGLKMGLKYLYSTLYMAVFGHIKTEVIKYEFGNYGELDKKKFREKMKEFLDELTDIEKIRGTLLKTKEKNELAMKKFQKLLKELLPKEWNK
jgi:glycosyltransferase involved in cell wall biosynthesis